MIFEEKTMKSDKLYEGKLLNLRIDTVEMPNKRYSKREIVEHPGAVAVIAITDDNQVILVKQFRKAVEKFLLEVPAGKIELNEEPRETAIRELQEETGYIANKIEYLLEFYTSPGFSNEKISLFLATKLTEGEINRDTDEHIEICKYDIEELVKMANRGDILDAKTIISINLAKKHIDKKQ